MKGKISFALYLTFIVMIVILADLDKLPLHLLIRIPHYDWIAHFFLYGQLNLLMENILKGKRISFFRWSVEKSFFFTVSFITLEEFSQLMFPSRTFSVIDLFMGLMGVFFFSHGNPVKNILFRQFENFSHFERIKNKFSKRKG